MRFLGIILVIVIMSGAVIQNGYGHEPNFDIKTTNDILKFCEFFYQEYNLLGKNNFFNQHPHFPNLRSCEILYNHIAWNSSHPARDLVLIAEIEKFLGDSKYIKDRHLVLSDNIPNWVKKEAKLWINEESHDTGFAFGIRAMLEGGVLKLNSSERNCNEGELCFREGDFIKYSHLDKFKNVITVKFTVTSVEENEFKLNVETISKSGVIKNELIMDKKGIIKTKECCEYFDYLSPYQISMGENITNGLTVVAETTHTFDDKNHQVWLAKNNSGQNEKLIDKKTGLVMEYNFHDTEVLTVGDNIKLTETNFFDEKYDFNEYNVKIPKWWKDTTRWLLDEEISDYEYLRAMENLISRNILKV